MLKLYNTLTRKREEFKPIKAGEVGLYTCGPTVYNFAHIGNLRSYVFEDILRRVLLFNGFKVKQVMNITDVGHLTSDADEGEDKMLKGAKREGKTVWEVAEFYTKAFKEDTKRLNILEPDIWCKATDHIKEMIELVQRLEKNGFTYIAGGNVYYDVSKFPNYGKLAKLNLEEQQAGARTDVDENKKNPYDFVLWFTKSKFGDQEMKWESPWGMGYPGWHVECSAMSMKYLGEQFDIHCGGIDHIPIHHTNEIAQSEGATGKKWVNFWLHGEFLIIDKGKMAKSGENFITLQTLIDKGYEPLVYRYFCLSAHYRQQLKFSWEALDGAKNSLENFRNKVIEIKKGSESKTSENKYLEEFTAAINDDMNMPKAMAAAWAVIKDDKLGNKEKYELLLKFDEVLGLGIKDIKEEKVEIPADIQKLVDERQKARAEKDWATSDKIRDTLKEKGYSVEDTPQGPKIKKV